MESDASRPVLRFDTCCQRSIFSFLSLSNFLVAAISGLAFGTGFYLAAAGPGNGSSFALTLLFYGGVCLCVSVLFGPLPCLQALNVAFCGTLRRLGLSIYSGMQVSQLSQATDSVVRTYDEYEYTPLFRIAFLTISSMFQVLLLLVELVFAAFLWGGSGADHGGPFSDPASVADEKRVLSWLGVLGSRGAGAAGAA